MIDSVIGTIKSAYACDPSVETALGTIKQQLDGLVPDLVLLFIAGKHDPEQTLAILKEIFPAAQIVGGSAAGVISTKGSGYTGFEVGLIAFKGEDVLPQIFRTHDLLIDEHDAGYALGQMVQQYAPDDSLVFLMFDSIAQAAPLRLHPASKILDGFQSSLSGRRLHLIGGGTLTDINLSDGWLLDEGKVQRHTALALIFPPSIKAETVILHGCRPVSSFIEITRIEGAEVLELNGEPALTVVERMLGLTLGTISGRELSLVATLGQKFGDPFAPYDEKNYVNRLILFADPVRKSITLFEPDFALGDYVQIMSRDNMLMLESVETGIAELKDKIADLNCLLGLYVDCAGRASVMSGADTEEAELVATHLAPNFPFMGFYSGVEIAPLEQNNSRPLDWTGVITILHRTS